MIDLSLTLNFCRDFFKINKKVMTNNKRPITPSSLRFEDNNCVDANYNLPDLFHKQIGAFYFGL